MSLIIKRAQWDQQAERFLEKALQNDPFETINDLKNSINEGRASLYNIYDASLKHIGSFTLHVDRSPLVNELVISNGGGDTPKGQSLYTAIVPFLRVLAEENDCDYIRVHTRHRGVVKLMERAGYRLDEYIGRMEVRNGQ